MQLQQKEDGYVWPVFSLNINYFLSSIELQLPFMKIGRDPCWNELGQCNILCVWFLISQDLRVSCRWDSHLLGRELHMVSLQFNTNEHNLTLLSPLPNTLIFKQWYSGYRYCVLIFTFRHGWKFSTNRDSENWLCFGSSVASLVWVGILVLWEKAHTSSGRLYSNPSPLSRADSFMSTTSQCLVLTVISGVHKNVFILISFKIRGKCI